jgi:hypothetical protein
MRADQLAEPGHGPVPVLVLVPVFGPGRVRMPGPRAVRRMIMMMTAGPRLLTTHEHSMPGQPDCSISTTTTGRHVRNSRSNLCRPAR